MIKETVEKLDWEVSTKDDNWLVLNAISVVQGDTDQYRVQIPRERFEDKPGLIESLAVFIFYERYYEKNSERMEQSQRKNYKKVRNILDRGLSAMPGGYSRNYKY